MYLNTSSINSILSLHVLKKVLKNYSLCFNLSASLLIIIFS